jgi:GDP-L-fucose synthase
MDELSRLSPSSRIFVAGHGGLIGSAIVRQLKKSGYLNLILATRDELDLRDQAAVSRFFARQLPEFVFLSAAKAGGILAKRTHPADFLYDNLAIASNVIHAAWQHGARKLIFLGAASIYPQLAPQPLKEEYLLTSPLEPASEANAIARIAGLKLAAAYREQYGFPALSLIPANLYGPGDNFELETSHVVSAMIRRFHEAKIWRSSSVTLWGTGTARREFLHVDDLAAAACFVMQNYAGGDPLGNVLNVGSGEEMSIAELAVLVADVVGYGGNIRFDAWHPNGAPRRFLDSSRMEALGWRARTRLAEGISSTYEWYCANAASIVAV